MIYLLYTIHIVISLFLIAIVLLQQGKGADLSVFGGGATQTAFGARGATTLLHKLTVSAFVGFILTTLAIGFLQAGGTSTPISQLEEAKPALPSESSTTPATTDAAATTPAAPATEAPATAPATGAAGAPPAEAPATGTPAEAPATAPAEAPGGNSGGGN